MMKKVVLVVIILIFACSELLYSASDVLRVPMVFNEPEEQKESVALVLAKKGLDAIIKYAILYDGTIGKRNSLLKRVNDKKRMLKKGLNRAEKRELDALAKRIKLDIRYFYNKEMEALAYYAIREMVEELRPGESIVLHDKEEKDDFDSQLTIYGMGIDEIRKNNAPRYYWHVEMRNIKNAIKRFNKVMKEQGVQLSDPEHDNAKGTYTITVFKAGEGDLSKIREVFAELGKYDHVMSLAYITQEMIESGWLKRMIENKLVFDVNVDNMNLVVRAMKILKVVNKETKYKHGYVGFRINTKRAVTFKGQVRKTLKKLIKIDKLITKKADGLHNFYIEIPATPMGIEAGIAAIRDHGINIKWTDIATLENYEACVAAYKQTKQDISNLKKGTYGVSFAGIVPSSIDVQNFYFIFARNFLYDQEWRRFSRENDTGLQRISWERKNVTSLEEIKDVRFSGTVSNISPEALKMMIEQTPLWDKTRDFDIFFKFEGAKTTRAAA